MDPQVLHQLVAESYQEIAHLLPVDSWNCREVACIALGVDRARGGHGKLATGLMHLPNGDSTWHTVYVCDDPRGMTIDVFDGVVRLSQRHTLGLTLGMIR